MYRTLSKGFKVFIRDYGRSKVSKIAYSVHIEVCLFRNCFMVFITTFIGVYGRSKVYIISGAKIAYSLQIELCFSGKILAPLFMIKI